MARLPRLVIAKHLHYLIARGHNDQPVFLDEADYQHFLNWLREAAQRLGVAIHAYALLPNRLHLLATPGDELALSKMMQAVGRHYVPYFNARHGRSGSLWEGRFRATVVEADRYFSHCAHLIEYQPLLAGLSTDISAYRWSSHAHHVGLIKQAWLSDHPAYWQLGNTPFEREAAYQQLCSVPPEASQAASIDQATHKAWALGSEAFRRSLTKLTERRLEPAKRGRPSKSPDKIPRTLVTTAASVAKPVRNRAPRRTPPKAV